MASIQIDDLEALRREHDTCGIVALDIEPWGEDRNLAREIALSFLPPLNHGGTHLPPRDLRSFVVPTYTLSINGRHRPDEGPRRVRLDHGVRRHILEDEVESEIIHILDMFLATVSARPRLILTGFDLGFEMKLLADQYPRVLSHFWARADTQTLCQYVLTTGNRKMFSQEKPSLRNMLIALGLDDGNTRERGHRAGNDTANTLATLLYLLDRPPDAPKLQYKLPHDYRKRARNQKYLEEALFDTRPLPIEEYPFTVKLSLSGAVIPSPTSLLGMHRFRHFEIKALGSRPQEELPQSCWICFPSMEVLGDFVELIIARPMQQIHLDECLYFQGLPNTGCHCDPSNQGRWDVETYLPPGSEDWTDQEWEESEVQAQKITEARRALEREAAVQMGTEKKTQRREMRQQEEEKFEEELEEEGYCLPWGCNEDEWSGNTQSDKDSGAGSDEKSITGAQTVFAAEDETGEIDTEDDAAEDYDSMVKDDSGTEDDSEVEANRETHGLADNLKENLAYLGHWSGTRESTIDSGGMPLKAMTLRGGWNPTNSVTSSGEETDEPSFLSQQWNTKDIGRQSGSGMRYCRRSRRAGQAEREEVVAGDAGQGAAQELWWVDDADDIKYLLRLIKELDLA